MSLRIHTNLASIAAQHQIKKTSESLEVTLRQMASGKRIHPQNANPADKAIALQLEGQAKGWQASQQNIGNIIAFTDIAEGGLNEQSNLLIRLKELAIQAANSEWDENSRSLLNLEFQQILKEIDRIAQTTAMGKRSLLNNPKSEFEVQVGPGSDEYHRIVVDLTANTSVKSLDLSGEGIETASDARGALKAVEQAQWEIAKARAQFGSFAARLRSALSHAEEMEENLYRAYSNVADADMAQTTSDFYRLRALQQYQMASLAEANQQPMSVIKLIV
ncbi:MAG: flagellin [Bdellovibrionaceae bacterium]|nr:flagellin [Pseudobdellovibrionaceae bacterium]MDW8189452.1 flagellin [Pseudobdellovibrionaceae bacterium]